MSLEITLRIAPGELRINRAWRKTKAGMRRSEQYREAMRAVAADIRDASPNWRYRDFPVEVQIIAYWPTHAGDVDAPVKGILDALKKGGIYGDDKQVVRLVVEKHLNSDDPRICLKVAPVKITA